MTLRISIVITCYNYERYVAGAIKSALGQSRPADEIIVLSHGEIVERGAHANLLKQNGLYAAMWKRQQEHHQEAFSS